MPINQTDEEKINKEIDFPRHEGTCRFCGSVIPVIGADKSDADLKASQECDCGGYKKEQKISGAKKSIQKLFGTECRADGFCPVSEKAIDLMGAVVEAIHAGAISSAALNICGAKAALSVTAKGKIKVVRTDQRQQSFES